LREQFDDVDSDKDGQITLGELNTLMKEWTSATDSEIETLFNELDQSILLPHFLSDVNLNS
jgi:Ca2+-binding EF-hand superfamily protein